MVTRCWLVAAMAGRHHRQVSKENHDNEETAVHPRNRGSYTRMPRPLGFSRRSSSIATCPAHRWGLGRPRPRRCCPQRCRPHGRFTHFFGVHTQQRMCLGDNGCGRRRRPAGFDLPPAARRILIALARPGCGQHDNQCTKGRLHSCPFPFPPKGQLPDTGCIGVGTTNHQNWRTT